MENIKYAVSSYIKHTPVKVIIYYEYIIEFKKNLKNTSQFRKIIDTFVFTEFFLL
jgi:hypothetical protein